MEMRGFFPSAMIHSIVDLTLGFSKRTWSAPPATPVPSQTTASPVTCGHSCPGASRKAAAVAMTGTGDGAVEKGAGAEEEEPTEEGGKKKSSNQP